MDAEAREKLPTSDSAYEKWFDASRNPDGNIWAVLNNHFDNDALYDALLRSLNQTKLRQILLGFGVVLGDGEEVDKAMLAGAITAQFSALAAGNGNCDNIIEREYKKERKPSTKLDTYLLRATGRTSMMRLPGEDEYSLYQFFVCGNIGLSSAVFPRRVRGRVLEEATLQKILKFDERTDIWCSIIIGACGCGKTMMIQHLFLESYKVREETGKFPILAKLRNLKPSYRDLTLFLTHAIQEYDVDFTEDDLKGLLRENRVQILLDGLDEMDPLETQHFQTLLAELRHRYPNNQIVISSRQCGALSGIRDCVHFYLHPLTEDQADRLIDKLLTYVDDPNAKETVYSLVNPDTGFVRNNGFIATNPMLLTIIVRNYDTLKSYGRDRVKFYELLYNVLISQHDEEKQAFGRFFHSVSDADEFTRLFREFCAQSYLDNVFQFDSRSFEKYFRALKGKAELVNPAKCKKREFQQDVCATACMMYEQDSDIYYIDPGFQDYFFAEYYYFEDSENTKALGKKLWGVKPNPLRNYDAYNMFYEIAKDKMEVCFFLPYLESIFKGNTDDKAFQRFLAQGYGKVRYAVVDSGAVQNEMIRIGVSRFEVVSRSENECNFMHRLIYDQMNIDIHFELFSMVGKMGAASHASHRWLAYPISYSDSVLPQPSQIISIDGQQAVRIYSDDPDQYLALIEAGMDAQMDGTACVGYTFTIDVAQFPLDSMEIQYIIKLCKHSEVGMYDVFEKVKTFYLYLLEKQNENRFM